MQVKVRNGNVESALRVFKRKCSEVVFEVRERQFYEKPSVLRSKSKKSAKSRERRRNEKNNGGNYARN